MIKLVCSVLKQVSSVISCGVITPWRRFCAHLMTFSHQLSPLIYPFDLIPGPSISRPSISSRLPGAASSIRLQKGKENVPPSKQSTKTGLKMTTGRARKMTSGPKKTNPVPKRPTLKKTAKKAVVFAASAAVSSLEGHGNMMLPSGQGQISPPLVSFVNLPLHIKSHMFPHFDHPYDSSL